MAKRVPPGEKPFSPVDQALVRGVLTPVATPVQPKPSTVQSLPLQAQQAPSIPEGRQVVRSTAESPMSRELEKLSREKRVLLTSTEEWEFERLISDIGVKLQTPLKTSHLLRASVMLLRHAS